METALKNLHAAVRKACLPGLWIQGGRMARDLEIFTDEAAPDELQVRIRTSGQATVPRVVLYVTEMEWSCDCDAPRDPCAHVAAAVIALSEAQARGEKLPAFAVPTGRLSYRLAARDGLLAIDRVIVAADGSEQPLAGSLVALVDDGSTSSPVRPEHADLAIDRLLDTARNGVIAPERVAQFVAALSACADVRLGGRVVSASSDEIVPRAIVVDDPDDDGGVMLRIERPGHVTEVVARRVVLAGDTLHALAATDLSGERLEKLPVTRRFGARDLGELVLRVLPEIEARVPVELRSARLPARGRTGKPRVLMQLSQKAHTLSVTPTLVYGDPPQARIEGTRMVHLEGAVPQRDEAAERVLIDRLRDELNLVTERRVDFDGADAIRFASRLRTWRAGAVTETAAELFEQPALQPRFITTGDVFDLVFETETDGATDATATARRASAEAVLRAWQDGLDLVPLEGGGWAPLPAGWLARYGHRVADLLAARQDDGSIATAALPALAQLCDELEQPRPPGFQRLAPLLGDFAGIPEAKLPEGLQATLREYQKLGVNWLCFLRDAGLGALLADDMGLGKTLQMLCAVRGRTLVICPKSVVHNWADEIRRFRPDLGFAIYHGAKRSIDRNVAITLTTFAVLRLDAALLAEEAWDTVVIDEAQAIKNPDSQVARAAYGLQSGFRVALSGTPVENRLEELWSQFHFINRGLLGGRGDFQERYASAIGNGDKTAGVRLRERIRPFLLRRLKRDVVPELPPRTDTVLYCELDERERSVYDSVRAATRSEVIASLQQGGSVLAALEALLRLRQAACHPILVPGQTAESSSKVERLMHALEEAAADGHKALVFSQWTSLLDAIEPHLKSASIPFTRLDGSTRDRGKVVAEFQAAEGPPVMLVSLKAGGTGLNLTAADHVFLLDPWWNPATEDQAADRAHRIGQDRPVMVYRMVAKDTVEERILALQVRKRSLADVALGEGDTALALTRDDLMALLE